MRALLQQGITLLLCATFSLFPKAVVALRTSDQDSVDGIVLSRTSVMFQGDASTSNVTCKQQADCHGLESVSGCAIQLTQMVLF